MELRVSRAVLDQEASRVLVATQEKRVNLEKLDLMASMEKRESVEWLDLQVPEEVLEVEVLKVSKDKQEAEEKWELEETLAPVDGITTRQDLKETLEMQDHREILAVTERGEALVNLEDRALLAEEAHQDHLDLLADQVLMEFRESLALQDQEAHLDQAAHQDRKERKETLDQGVLEVTLVALEKKEDKDFLVARVSQEIQDLRVLLDLKVPVENQVRMEEMALVLVALQEERVMRASLDSQDQRELLVNPERRADLDPEETVDRGVSLETLVDLGRRERLDILGLMV